MQKQKRKFLLTQRIYHNFFGFAIPQTEKPRGSSCEDSRGGFLLFFQSTTVKCLRHNGAYALGKLCELRIILYVRESQSTLHKQSSC